MCNCIKTKTKFADVISNLWHKSKAKDETTFIVKPVYRQKVTP